MMLVAGSGRSGTTWVQDSLATANGLRPVFEPLHPYVSETGNRFAHRALTADDDAPELRQFLDEVCAGRRHVLWTKYRRRVRWLFPPPAEFRTRTDAGRVYRNWGKFFRELPRLVVAARRQEPLVKCIRANLMLGWLSRACGWKTVLIVRHPGAVIESELRGTWNAAFALDRFRNDSRLHELTNGRYLRLLGRELNTVEALATRWVIENQWVAQAAEANGVTVTFYEQLRSVPDVEWERIRVAFGLARAPGPEIIARPSQQSSPTKSAAQAADRDDPRWMRALSPDQRATIQGVLDEVGVTLYSMKDPDPARVDALTITKGKASAAS